MEKAYEILQREKLNRSYKTLRALWIVPFIAFIIVVAVNVAMGWYSFNNWVVIAIIGGSLYMNYKNQKGIKARLEEVERKLAER